MTGLNQTENLMSLLEIIQNEANTTLDQIKDAPPLAKGHYYAQVVGNAEEIESGRKGTPGLQFTLRLLSAKEDVDQQELEEHLDATKRKLSDVQVRHTIWQSPYFLQSLRDMLLNVLDVDGGVPLPQALAEVPGRNLIVEIIHRPFKDESGMARLRSDIGGLAKSD
jgi:hypothetical protein